MFEANSAPPSEQAVLSATLNWAGGDGDLWNLLVSKCIIIFVNLQFLRIQLVFFYSN